MELLGDRVDHLEGIGGTQLALGRALAGQGRVAEADEWIAAAERTVEQAQSVSYAADAWIARGDLESLRGDDRAAAALFRRAAEAMGAGELEI